MTDSEFQLWAGKCGQILHHALVEIRNLTYEEGNAKRINDLTDLTHNVPLFMIGRDDFVLGYLRIGFVEYAQKYYPESDPGMTRYVMILDMDEVAFRETYPTTRHWLEPAEAVA